MCNSKCHVFDWILTRPFFAGEQLQRLAAPPAEPGLPSELGAAARGRALGRPPAFRTRAQLAVLGRRHPGFLIVLLGLVGGREWVGGAGFGRCTHFCTALPRPEPTAHFHRTWMLSPGLRAEPISHAPARFPPPPIVLIPLPLSTSDCSAATGHSSRL